MPVAYNNHNMVLISIHPFAFRKIFVLIVALLGLSSAVCFADSLFMSLHSASHNHRVVNRGQPAFFAPERGGLYQCGRSTESLILDLPNAPMGSDDRSPNNDNEFASLRLETSHAPRHLGPNHQSNGEPAGRDRIQLPFLPFYALL
jgi:hypothetical protein